MVEQASQYPPIKWAQRKDCVLLTVDVNDMTNHKVDFTPEGKLTYKGESKGVKFEAVFEKFYKPVDVEKSRWDDSGRKMLLIVKKTDVEEESWPRVLASFDKQPKITVDWDKWQAVAQCHLDEALPISQQGNLFIWPTSWPWVG